MRLFADVDLIGDGIYNVGIATTPTSLYKPVPCFGSADWKWPSARRNIPYPRELFGNPRFPGLDRNGLKWYHFFPRNGKSPQRYYKNEFFTNN